MNCIVVLCDTLRRDHCGPYHHGRALDEVQSTEQPNWTVPTPNMDRLAERGTTFDRAYHGSTPCMPARRDIYTGRYELLERGWGSLEENDRDLPREVSGDPNSAIADRESDGKSVSQLITDYYHLWEQDSGNDHFGYTGFEFVRGHESDNWHTEPIEFDSPEESESRLQRHWRNLASISGDRPTTDGVPDDESAHFAARVFEEAAGWIDRNHDREDFYLHVDCFDPHEPFAPPQHLLKEFDPRGYDVASWDSLPAYDERDDHYTVDELRTSKRATPRWSSSWIDGSAGSSMRSPGTTSGKRAS